MTSINSRDLSVIRKNPNMSEELLTKIVGFEKKIKKLKLKNKRLI